MKILISGLASLLFLFAAFCVAASAQTVTGTIWNGTAQKGTTVFGTLVLDIPKELHVNSNRPRSEYAIPTTVRLSTKGGRLGRVAYPSGTMRKFQFSENPINVYEGTVFFPFKLTIPRNYRRKTISVKAVVRYQACTDEVCYPPRNKEITLTAKVR